VQWSPDREVSISSFYKGNLNAGLELFAEIGSKNIPVIGSQMRVFEGEYIPPKADEGGKISFKHAWKNNQSKLDNLEAQVMFNNENNELSLEFFLLSSLWDPDVITVLTW
jgi:hypothetical protein